MKKIRFVVFGVLLLFCTLCFVGCASVSVSTCENENGEISQLFVFDVDSAELASLGVSANAVTNAIEDKLKTYRDNFQNTISSKIQNDASILNDEKEQFLDSFDFSVAKKENSVWLQLNFESNSAYSYYYDLDNETDEDEELEIEKGFLTNKIIQKTSNVFSSMSESTRLVDKFVAEAKTWLTTNYSASVANAISYPKLSYTLVTPERKLNSDADEKTRNSNLYYHTWKIDKNDLDREISVYYNSPNTAAWWTIALAATALFVCGFLLWDKYSQKKPHN